MPGTSRTVTVPGTLTDARKARARLQLAGRPQPEPEPVDVWTLRELAAAFLRAREGVLAGATIYSYEEAYRLRIDPILGSVLLIDLTAERLEGWWREVREHATSRTVARHALEAIRAILRAGVEWGRLPADPSSRLRLPSKPTHEEAPAERALSAEQLARLFADGAASLPTETLLRIAGEAGLRRGEIIGLRWTDVDLQGRRVRVRRSVWRDRVAGARSVEKPTKGRRARVVPITPTLAGLLGELYAERVVVAGGDAAGYVWPGRDGGPMAQDTPTQTTERAMKRAGLLDEGKALSTLHGLRHTAGSLMLAAGTPLIVVSRVLGHADVQVTAQVYAHLTDDDQINSAADALERAVNGRTVRDTVRGDAVADKNAKGKPIPRGVPSGS